MDDIEVFPDTSEETRRALSCCVFVIRNSDSNAATLVTDDSDTVTAVSAFSHSIGGDSHVL